MCVEYGFDPAQRCADQVGQLFRVEFEDRDKALAKIDTALGPGYYHNRYWNMWKLPLFGCTDGTQVISEIKECLQTYPDVTVRVIAFDRQRQVQVAGFIVQK